MKVLLLLICLAACVAAGFSQSKIVKPDLTGTWEVDAARNKETKSQSSVPEQIKITHRDPELIIRRQIIIKGVPEQRDLTYYTDGRGETNPATAWLTANP